MDCVYFKGQRSAPYVYVISCKDHIFVGDSKHLPFVPWAQHIFSKNGFGLRKILLEKGFSIDAVDVVSVFCCSCSRLIREVQDGLQMMALKSISHNVYKSCLSNVYSLDRNFTILSAGDSAPSRSALKEIDWIDSYAEEIFNKFWDEYAGAGTGFKSAFSRCGI